MIGKLKYEQVEEMIKDMRVQKDLIAKLSKGRGVPEIADFLDALETYCKFLENTMELNKDADIALQGLVK